MKYTESFSDEDLDAAHDLCNNNTEALKHSKEAGCFHCRRQFPANMVREYAGVSPTQRAICPLCGIDSVIPAASFAISEDFLFAMWNHWFHGIDKPRNLDVEPLLLEDSDVRQRPELSEDWQTVYFPTQDLWEVDAPRVDAWAGSTPDPDRYSVTEDMPAETASLIAAAPKMLHLLERIEADASRCGHAHSTEHFLDDIRALLVSIKGSK